MTFLKVLALLIAVALATVTLTTTVSISGSDIVVAAMMVAVAAPTKTYLRKAQLADRYRTTTRHVERLVAAGRIPPPTLYMGRWPLWDEQILDANDRAAAVARPASKTADAAA